MTVLALASSLLDFYGQLGWSPTSIAAQINPNTKEGFLPISTNPLELTLDSASTSVGLMFGFYTNTIASKKLISFNVSSSETVYLNLEADGVLKLKSSSNVELPLTLPLTCSVETFHTIRLFITTNNIEVRLDSSEISTHSGTTNLGSVDSLSIHPSGVFSSILVLDETPFLYYTGDIELQSTGSVQEWTGELLDVTNIGVDIGTFLRTSTADSEQLYNGSDLVSTTITGGIDYPSLTIQAIVIRVLAQASTASSLTLSAGAYDSSQFSTNSTWSVKRFNFTGFADLAEVNSAEFGFRS